METFLANGPVPVAEVTCVGFEPSLRLFEGKCKQCLSESLDLERPSDSPYQAAHARTHTHTPRIPTGLTNSPDTIRACVWHAMQANHYSAGKEILCLQHKRVQREMQLAQFGDTSSHSKPITLFPGEPFQCQGSGRGE